MYGESNPSTGFPRGATEWSLTRPLIRTLLQVMNAHLFAVYLRRHGRSTIWLFTVTGHGIDVRRIRVRFPMWAKRLLVSTAHFLARGWRIFHPIGDLCVELITHPRMVLREKRVECVNLYLHIPGKMRGMRELVPPHPSA
jgi:hypothetical protein